PLRGEADRAATRHRDASLPAGRQPRPDGPVPQGGALSLDPRVRVLRRADERDRPLHRGPAGLRGRSDEPSRARSPHRASIDHPGARVGRHGSSRRGGGRMDYSFLVETYASERLKTLGVWSMFADDDLDRRPHPNLARDRTPREHMVHQCTSEDRWFTTMFGLDVGAPPLPEAETRLGFIRR